MTYKLIKHAKAIVTCDSEDTVYYDADILIEGPRIIEVGKDIQKPEAEIVSAENMIVYPGLINTHHHFVQTFARNLYTVDYPRMETMDWVVTMYDIFRHATLDVIYHSSIVALADLIKHGCTCAFDHQYCFNEFTGKQTIDCEMEAASLLGIRLHAGRSTNTAFSIGTPDIMLHMQESVEEYLEDCERLLAKYHDVNEFSMRQIVLAPCNPVNSTAETFAKSAELARKHGARMHTHMGEGENAGMVEKYGRRSLEWLRDTGFTGGDVWVAHGWEIDDEELIYMAGTGMGVTHCPAPAVLGGYPILDIPAMQNAGMLVGLGCDGCATNDSSNLLDSLRMAYLLQTYHAKTRGASCSAYDILKLATVNNAKILGRDDIGSLQRGKAADLFMVDTTKLDLVGTVHDPKNLLAKIGVTGEVAHTMINGKTVYQNGEFSNIDERQLALRAEKVCTESLRKPNREYFSMFHEFSSGQS